MFADPSVEVHVMCNNPNPSELENVVILDLNPKGGDPIL